MLIARINPNNGKHVERELDVTQEEYNNWHHNRVVIQRAMPRLNPEEREFILTGLVGDEYEQLTAEEHGDRVEKLVEQQEEHSKALRREPPAGVRFGEIHLFATNKTPGRSLISG